MTFDPTQNRATLSPEAVAQLVADLTESDKPLLAGVIPFAGTRLRIRKAADMLTTLAAENATLRASEAAALGRVKVLEAGLADPVSVHANMLRGAIAMPSFANIKHLYAAEFAALTPTADKEPTT